MDSKRRNLLAGLLGTGGLLSTGVLSAGALSIGLTPAEAQEAAINRKRRPPLSNTELKTILDQAVATANVTNSPLRSITGTPRPTRMHIAIVARDGSLLAFRSMDDAWEGSRDIAIAKARTAAFFSSDQNALTSRIIGVLSQAHGADGEGAAGPLWGIWASNQVGTTGGPAFRNGIITFPGGIPLYKGGVLVGGVGVSGDGVDQDDTVALAASIGFRPGAGVANPAGL